MSTEKEPDPEMKRVSESIQAHLAVCEKMRSDDPAERQQAIDAMTDFCRCWAREHALELPIAMIDGVIPVYESDFSTPKGKKWPNVRQNLADRVWASPYAVPTPWVKDEHTEELLKKRHPELAAKLKELTDAAVAQVLASQDRRIAQLILSSTYSHLQHALEEFLKKLPWTPPAVDARGYG